ncbi:MAG: glycosyltransferase family 4 protein [Corynebacterium sp.]|nr:glycosyltransferase family 4 protein [Corynebacterium sp.]
MAQVLLVTNDFPPTLGGIQSYLRDFVDTVDPQEIIVFASTQDAQAAAEFDAQAPYTVIRANTKVMLPTPDISKQMQAIIRKYGINTVWFGAAAPLGLLGKAAKRAGATRVVASTHGHEIGWSLFFPGRKVLQAIGTYADVITYISEYTRPIMQAHFGDTCAYIHMPSGVDANRFVVRSSEQRTKLRAELGYPNAQTIVCISRLVARKGQDRLIEVMPEVLRAYPQAQLVIVGGGPYERRLHSMVAKRPEIQHRVHFTGRVSEEKMAALLESATIFAMPCRTRGNGLDVEGLGIVYLEAQACGIPVIAGDSGGAPETVTGDTGIVVGGNDRAALTQALVRLLGDASLRERMGTAGREHVQANWNWQIMGARLHTALGLAAGQ